MYHSIIEIQQCEFLGAGSDIAIFIEVSLKLPFDRSNQSVAADVKFPLVYQQGV